MIVEDCLEAFGLGESVTTLRGLASCRATFVAASSAPRREVEARRDFRQQLVPEASLRDARDLRALDAGPGEETFLVDEEYVDAAVHDRRRQLVRRHQRSETRDR